MSTPDQAPEPWTATILTWRAPDAMRMESVRVQVAGNRLRANGRIVAAATAAHPAFGAYYDLQTDETGAIRRVGLTVTLAERERQLSIARDEENMWLVTDYRGESRAGFDGAVDVDVLYSPFFNTLPIRRAGLQRQAGTITASTIHVRLPELEVSVAPVSYRSADSNPVKVELSSPAVGTATVVVDTDGFIVDYPGLAERI